jgi:hypothetical protein
MPILPHTPKLLMQKNGAKTLFFLLSVSKIDLRFTKKAG